jgi:P4 family phage/plasmid primase-like protien
LELESYTKDAHGFADYFLSLYRDVVRYARDADRFYLYDGRQWRPDTGRHLEMRSKVQELSSRISKEGVGKAAVALAKLGDSSTGVNKLVQTLANMPEIWVESSEFGTQPQMLNFMDCTLDVTRGQFDPVTGDYDPFANVHSHTQADMLDSVLPVDYKPELAGTPAWDTPLWDKLVGHMCDHNPDLIDNLEDALAYGLYGSNPEQYMVFLVGAPNIGKTQILELMVEFAGSLGGYGKIELVTSTHGYSGEHDSLRGALRGKRFIMLGEASAKIKLSEGKVKDLTGSSWVPTRELGKEQVNTRVTWTLYAATNELPALPSTMDDAIARRMWIFDLPGKQVSSKDRDTSLTAKILKYERDAVVNKLAIRLQRMFEGGTCKVTRAAACIHALDTYRSDYDTISEFCQNVVIQDATGRVSYNDLHEAYLMYCRKHAYAQETKRRFLKRVAEIMAAERDSSNSRMKGIALAYSAPDA